MNMRFWPSSPVPSRQIAHSSSGPGMSTAPSEMSSSNSDDISVATPFDPTHFSAPTDDDDDEDDDDPAEQSSVCF